jgi:small-conductance mechanosensitive channel
MSGADHRDPRLDVFRGLAMFIILVAHIPLDPWIAWIPARFGPSDAAEIFVFCSGVAAALAFGGTFRRHGFALGSLRVLHRCWQLYWSHLAVFVTVAALCAAGTKWPGSVDHVRALWLHPFFAAPDQGLVHLLTLTYVPNYFDILPMYLVVLAMVPLVMALARLHPALVAAFCVGLHLVQGRWGLDLPAEWWSDRPWFFNPFGWQLLFFTGFAFGSGWLPAPPRRGWLLGLALAFVAIMLPVSWQPLWSDIGWLERAHLALAPWADKTHAGVLRYLHFLALAQLALGAVERWPVLVAGRAGRTLAGVGQQALPVFLWSMGCAQLLGMALDWTGRGPLAVLGIHGVGFLSLIGVAYLARLMKAQPWRHRPSGIRLAANAVPALLDRHRPVGRLPVKARVVSWCLQPWGGRAAAALLAGGLAWPGVAQAAPAPPPIGIGVRLVELRLALEAGLVGLQSGAAQAWSGLALLPTEVGQAVSVVLGLAEGGTIVRSLGLLGASLGLGGAAWWLTRRRLAGYRRELGMVGDEALMGSRLVRLGGRALLELVGITAFAATTLLMTLVATAAGTRAQELVITYVTGATAALLLEGLLAAVLAPEAPALRLLALGDGLARWLHRWLLLLGTVGLLAWLTAGLLIRTGFTTPAHLALVMLTGLLLLAIAMILAGRRIVAAAILDSIDPLTGQPPGRLACQLAATWQLPALLLVAVLWIAWCARILAGQESALWPALGSLLILLLVPAADRGLAHMLARVVGLEPSRPGDRGEVGYLSVLRRAVQGLLAFAAIVGVLELWDASPLAALGLGMGPVVLQALFRIVMALSLAGTAWALAKAAIDPHLVQVTGPGGDHGKAMAQTTRAQTLLPLLRGLVMAVLLAVSALIVLRALGVDTAPLLAGAGVVGIAIGFGAQTLVRDIVSGIFFLIDDAFRLGEYVDVGVVKGRVERITRRSLHLRHHRGAVNVIPFGELKAIVNHSRDWVIDKLDIGVAHDTDVAKVKQLVKQVSAELMADPNLAVVILEPLKSQGVARIGDFNLQIRLKVTTRPGEQFQVRRVAYDAIKRAFEANGIRFANPLAALAGGFDGGNAHKIAA